MPRALLATGVLLAVAGCAGEASDDASTTAAAATGEVTLEDAVAGVNEHIARGELPLRPITKDELLGWLADYETYELVPRARAILEEGLGRGVLPAPFGLAVQPALFEGMAPRIVVTPLNAVVVEGRSLLRHTTEAEKRACTEARVCLEPFAGELPPARAADFPASVPLRIEETHASGQCSSGACEGDILAIELLLRSDNVDDAVAYFRHGFDPALVRGKALAALGAAPERWVRIEELLPSWVGAKASTYPTSGDNEVCHGPARQFFSPTLENGGWDRSTEATAIVLQRYYCRVDAPDAPGFGDYLYKPGTHSGRFILSDPASHRWIGFSVQSGGASAYRFWWVDEDFSGDAFGHTPYPDFRTDFVDVWRRCR